MTLPALPTARDNAQTHAELLGAWLASYASPSTRAAYRTDLRIFLAFLDQHDLDLLEVRRRHLDVFLRGREQLDSASTMARRLASISAMYRYAASEGVIEANPAALIRRPAVDRDHSTSEALTHAEAVRYLDAARAHSQRAHALVLLLLDTGVRISEALGTTNRDLGADRLRIRRKGGKTALVPLPDSLKTILSDLLGTHGTEIARGDEPACPIFATATGRPWQRTDAARTLRAISEKAGIGKVITPHVLRHTHATLALDAGVALHHLQDSLGHADPRTTRRYDHSRGRLRDHSVHTVARLFE